MQINVFTVNFSLEGTCLIKFRGIENRFTRIYKNLMQVLQLYGLEHAMVL